MDTRDSKRRLIATAILAVMIVGGHFAASVAGGPLEAVKYLPLRCPLHFLTGIACPTCGLGRSLALAVSGRMQEAWQMHPLGPILLMGTVLGMALWWATPERFAQGWSRSKNFASTHPVSMMVMVAIYVVWGFCRVAP